MQRHAWKQIAWGALAAVLIFAPSLSVAQEKGSSTAKSQPPSQAREKDQSEGGPQEGIKVHGHWTIVIKNADGSVASRREFENALVGNSGGATLSAILSRNATVGEWGIELNFLPVGVDFIVEPNFPSNLFGSAPLDKNLAVQAPSSGLNALALVLSGSTKFSAAANILNVATFLTCASGGGCGTNQFTAHDLSASPVAVQSGQTVDVTVVISFS